MRKRAHSRAKRQRPGAETDAPRLHARTVSWHHRKAAPRQTGHRHQHGHHRRLSRRNGGGLRANAARLCAKSNSTRPTFSNTRRAATRPPPTCPTSCRQAIKEERNQRLLNLVNEIGRAQIPEPSSDAQVQILVEGPSKKNAARMTGPHPLQQDRGVRRLGPPSRPVHGREDQPRRLLHAVRRSGGGRFVSRTGNSNDAVRLPESETRTKIHAPVQSNFVHWLSLEFRALNFGFDLRSRLASDR